jgi:DNA-binding MarR family transcriptional regulator
MKANQRKLRVSDQISGSGVRSLPADRFLEEELEFYRTLIEVCLQLPRVLSLRSERAFGTPFTMAAALAYLSAAPKDGISMSDLSRILNLSNSRVSRLIHEMETAGWVKREKSKKDGRSSLARITPAGRKKLSAEGPFHIANIRELSVQVFTARERALLQPYLERLRSHLAPNS